MRSGVLTPASCLVEEVAVKGVSGMIGDELREVTILRVFLYTASVRARRDSIALGGRGLTLDG